MTTLRIRIAVATVGGEELPQPYVCEDLDAMLRLDADVYVGCGVAGDRHRQAWWRKMREAGLETYHRHGDAPVSTRLPVVHPRTGAVRLGVTPVVQVLGSHVSARRLERCRSRGITSVIASPIGVRAPAYHPDQVVVAEAGSLGLVVVPAPGVTVLLDGELAVLTADLHVSVPVLAADLTLTAAALRAGRGSGAAPDAAPRPLRHGVRGAHAAR